MSEVAATTKTLELPSVDDRLFWDLQLWANVLPAVSACDEMGMFPLLAKGPLTLAEVAVRLNLTEEWAEVLLGSMAALQLLRVQDGRFHLTDQSRNYLLPESPYYRGQVLRRFAQSDPGARVRNALGGANKSTRSVVREWTDDDLTVEQAMKAAPMMHSMSLPAAVGVACNGDFSGVRRLLDVAGGSGTYSIAIAQRRPEIRCTVAEINVVCEVAKHYIADHGVGDRVDARPLNMFFDEWPRDYDAIFLSQVLHDWGLEQRTEIIRRAFAALPSGGRIYVHEMLMNDAADGPLGPVLFSLNMRTGTAGKQFTVPELRSALEAAGFRGTTVQNTYGYFSLMVGHKA